MYYIYLGGPLLGRCLICSLIVFISTRTSLKARWYFSRKKVFFTPKSNDLSHCSFWRAFIIVETTEVIAKAASRPLNSPLRVLRCVAPQGDLGTALRGLFESESPPTFRPFGSEYLSILHCVHCQMNVIQIGPAWHCFVPNGPICGGFRGRDLAFGICLSRRQ